MCHVLLCQVRKGCRLSEGGKNQRHATNANQLGQLQVIFRSCNDVQMTCNDTFSMLLGYILRTPPSLIALVSAFEFWNVMPCWKKMMFTFCTLFLHSIAERWGTRTGWSHVFISTSRSITAALGSLASFAWWMMTWCSPNVASVSSSQ